MVKIDGEDDQDQDRREPSQQLDRVDPPSLPLRRGGPGDRARLRRHALSSGRRLDRGAKRLLPAP